MGVALNKLCSALSLSLRYASHSSLSLKMEVFGKFLNTNMGRVASEIISRVQIKPLDVTTAKFLTPLFGILADDDGTLFLVSFAADNIRSQ